MAPALRIPVALDLDSLQQQTQKASDRVGETLKIIGRQFTKLNGDMLGVASTSASGVALAWTQGLAGSILRFSTFAAGAVAAFKLIDSAIDLTRGKLQEMVEVANKSQDTLTSPLLFQAFVSESRKLQVSAQDMEDALTHAFTATKDKSPVDLDKWEVGEERITDVEKALRVYNETLAKAQGQTLQGLVLFRDAQSQDEKVRAVLAAMVQLDTIGQHLAALDIGEKMFGTKFVDNIRQGRTSAEGLLQTLNEAARNKDAFFSDDMVRRAKEIDDQLKQAQQHLDRELKPTWEGLASTTLTIKSAWADIVELMAKAAAFSNKADFRITDFLIPGAGPLLRQFRQSLPSAGGNAANSQLAQDAGLGDIGRPPSRGTGAAPTLKQQDTSRDRFEASVDSIEKRTAATQAETAAIDLYTEARERAKIAAQLETVAKQINKEAGLGDNVVLDEQRARIDQVAAAWGRAELASERARSPMRTWIRDAGNLEKQLDQLAANGLENLSNSIVSVINNTQSMADAFRQLGLTVVAELEKMIVKMILFKSIQAAGSFFGFSTGGSVDSKSLGFAEGGAISGPGTGTSDDILARVSNGEYIVNANAARRYRALLDAINGNTATPHFAAGGPVNVPALLPSSRGGAGEMSINVSIDLTGANGDDTIREISAQAAAAGVQQGLKQYDSALPGRLKDINRRYY